MLFNSWTFLLFFLAVFSLYQATPGWTAKKSVLLLASYLFYAAWNPPYIGILVLSTVVDWWLARRIARAVDPPRRRAFLLVSLICNLGLLCFFKYGSFLLDNFRMACEVIGVTYVPPIFDIVLPIGISFYTFASLSYTIDVYRDEIRADASLLDYALFVSFFPHLVAGPIVRARQLLPQIKQPRIASPRQIWWGVVLIILGLFSKVVMADNVFAPTVDNVFMADASHVGALDAWAAVLGFSGQIYYDFSGYSLCAIGLALCFGFAFPDNFRHPYGARGFSDFWRRWHITLSTWLRDYLYIPLGGNRLGRGRTYLNLMLTMLIGGLWHGASWMFVAWGALHGTFLAIERLIRGSDPGSAPPRRALDLGLTLLTFLAVTLAWVPFRAPSAQVAWEILSGLVSLGLPHHLDALALGVCFTGMVATVLWHIALRDSSLEECFGKLGGKSQAALLGACLIAMFLMSGRGERAFIYFQF
jgi:alginate O-acetyltransferase complex protein AlgI